MPVYNTIKWVYNLKIITVKIKNKRLLLVFLIILTAFFLVLEAVSVVSAKKPEILDNESRVNFINSLGISVREEPVEQKEIIIPQVFNDVYLKYNLMQLSAGYDLSLYKGKTATLFKYATTQENNDSIFVNLIICNGLIIGGDISSAKINGFILPLKEYKSETR